MRTNCYVYHIVRIQPFSKCLLSFIKKEYAVEIKLREYLALWWQLFITQLTLCNCQIVCCLVSLTLSLKSDTTYNCVPQFEIMCVCVCYLCTTCAHFNFDYHFFCYTTDAGMGESKKNQQNKTKTISNTWKTQSIKKLYSCCYCCCCCCETVKSKIHITVAA